MQTPLEPNDTKAIYLIDRIRNGNVWYLWTVEDGEWVVLKTGDWQQIVKKLGELKEG